MKQVLILLPILLAADLGCVVGAKVPIASPNVKAGNVESEIEGDVGGDVAGTKVTVGAGSSDSIALWLAIIGLVVALIAGPFGGHYYQKILRPKRLKKQGRCGECGKMCSPP